MTMAPVTVKITENDLYYLNSIRRQMNELTTLILKNQLGPTIGTEVFFDNKDWFGSFTDRIDALFKGTKP